MLGECPLWKLPISPLFHPGSIRGTRVSYDWPRGLLNTSYNLEYKWS